MKQEIVATFLAAACLLISSSQVSAASLKNIGTECTVAAGAGYLTDVQLKSSINYIEDYTPVLPRDRTRKVVLKTVPHKLTSGEVVKADGVSMKLKDDDVLLVSGSTKNGKPWTLTKHYFGLGTCIFTADLDLDGVQDLIFLQATGACGIAPPAVLTVIMFDALRRPFPMEVTGYFSADQSSWNAKNKEGTIDDLILVGEDEHAVLICNQLDSALGKDRNRTYWRTLMYQASHASWHLLKSYNGKKLPMLVRYTYKPNSKTIPDPVPALAHFDDGSYGITRDKLCRSGKITGLGFDKDDSERALNGIKIDTKLFKETDRWKSFFSSFIIRDGADSYDVLSLDTKDGAKLLRTCQENGTMVRYLPRSIPDGLPLYLWIKDKK